MCARVDANGIDCVCVQIMCACVDANGVDRVCTNYVCACVCKWFQSFALVYFCFK